MVVVVRVTRHIIAGNGCRKAEYRRGDLVLTGLAHATEWCLRGWAEPADSPDSTVASPSIPALVECFPCEALVSSS